MDESLSSYLRAVRPEPFRILGEELLPLSLGHHTLLAALQNRFVLGKDAPDFPDLVQALFVCTRSYKDGCSGIRGKAYRAFYRKLSRRLKLRGLLVRVGFLPVESISVNHMLGAFGGYLEAHSSCPEIIPETLGDDAHDMRRGRKLGAPLLQLVKLTLLAKLNHSPDEAMNKPWGEALHDSAAYYELEGKTKIASEDDRETHAEHLELLNRFSSQLEELERRYANGPSH